MPESPPLQLSEAVLREAAERVDAVRQRIAKAARRAGRDPESITLVGVAKRQPLERIVGVVRAGVRVLGENFVQEARTIRPLVEAALARPTSGDAPGSHEPDRSAAGERGSEPPLRWRMVGRLQRNKVALAVQLFDAVESVDRLELVAPLARHAAEAGRRLEVLVQVNLGDEPQKGGCRFEDAPALARALAREPALQLAGLMGVPPASEDPEASRAYFRRLREARDGWAGAVPELAGCALSMGMSHDLEVAIEEGATLVRVGTALFGPRLPSPR